MKKIFTLLALTISFSMNAQMDDNSANNNSATGTNAVSNGIWHRQQVELNLQQWDMKQQQVECILQQWEWHNSKWILFYSNGKSTTASGDILQQWDMNTTASDYGSLVIGQYNSSGSSVTIVLLHLAQQTQLL